MLIDHVKIEIKAGNGGNGAISFRREKYVAAGGPDGGDGGRGGNIVFRVDDGVNTLLAYRYRHKFVAGHGGDGKGDKFHGATAPDLIIPVPRGTLIKDAESGAVIHDMSDGQDYISCRGGRGGWGNRHFATPTRQIPNFAKNGTKGEERELILELKMLADVGLIGMPSVGKSSLLARISAARPKIAAYHFTTLSPNLGVVKTGEGAGFVAADIPGLIEGAADGAGLGHKFLRHVERCRLLLHVVDISGSEGRDPAGDVRVIDAELARYSAELAKRPQVIVANKCDMIDEGDPAVAAFVAEMNQTGREVLFVSAATGKGLPELVHRVSGLLAALPPLTVFAPEWSEADEADTGEADALTVRVEDGVYFAEGKWLYDLMGRINFDDYESLAYFQKMLIKGGIIAKLEEAGCTDGDTVDIYGFEFDFVK